MGSNGLLDDFFLVGVSVLTLSIGIWPAKKLARVMFKGLGTEVTLEKNSG